MHLKTRVTALLGVAVLVGLTYAWAEDTVKPAKPAKPAPAATAKPAPAAKAEVPKKASKGRLPPHFGKAGLSDAQRDKVYAIQTKYKADLDKLEEQLRTMRAQEMTEMEGVLTPEQKTKVEQFRAEAQKKRDEKKKTAEPDDDDEEKPAAAAK